MNLSSKIIIQYLLPQHILSWLCGKLASCRIQWIKNFFIMCFIKKYKINLIEYKEENPYNYATFNEFFTRELKVGMRPLPRQNNIIIAPCDGTISQIGKIKNNTLIQAKGFNYTLFGLLGSKEFANNFVNGHFATIYLAPSNYHRVHMPCSGTLLHMSYIPGKLFSVNKKTAEVIPNLFANNERVVAIFETLVGKMAVILVGAMIVGGIETSWAGTINLQHAKAIRNIDYRKEQVVLARGDEMGRFKLGSTVIVLFGEHALNWQKEITLNQPLKMGAELGNF